MVICSLSCNSHISLILASFPLQRLWRTRGQKRKAKKATTTTTTTTKAAAVTKATTAVIVTIVKTRTTTEVARIKRETAR